MYYVTSLNKEHGREILVYLKRRAFKAKIIVSVDGNSGDCLEDVPTTEMIMMAIFIAHGSIDLNA